MELNFRDLLADEIELRVGSTNDSGFQLLLYKNARVDMALLDEVVGVGNWQREHIILGNDIYCRLGIWNKELNQWVWKTDAGASGSIEEEKSKASDSFKRAATNFGLGRCLYTAPFVWIATKDKSGKPTSEDKKQRYSVKVIEYKNHKISKLAIINEKTKQVVYSYGYKENVSQNGENATKNENEPQVQEPKGSITTHDKTLIQSYVEKLPTEKGKENFFNWLDKWFNTMSIENLTKSQGETVVAKLGLDKGE